MNEYILSSSSSPQLRMGKLFLCLPQAHLLGNDIQTLEGKRQSVHLNHSALYEDSVPDPEWASRRGRDLCPVAYNLRPGTEK